MEDKRFAELFTDPNFQINQDSEEFRLLNPVVQKANEKKLKPKKIVVDEDSEMEEEVKSDLDESDKSSEPESSSDDEHQWKKSVKEEYKRLQHEKKLKERKEKLLQNKNSKQIKEPKFYEIKEGASVYSNSKNTNEILRNEKLKKLPLLNRLKHMNESNENESTLVFRSDSYGNKQMTFLSRKVNIKVYIIKI